MKKPLLMGLGVVLGAGAAVAAVSAAREQQRREQERMERLRRSARKLGGRIVIVGAGFGGITTAEALLRRLPPESGWTVTLVDRRNYFLFTPLLYHAATGLVDPSSILYPVRALSRAENYEFIEAEVEGVDLKNRRVHLPDRVLEADVLVYALGSTTNFFGLEEHLQGALPLKTCGDSIVLRNRVIDSFEHAEACGRSEERRRYLTFAVVGGGATGVELAGALRGLVRGTLALHYPRVRAEEVRVLLFEAGAELLPGLPRNLAAHARKRLCELGVQIHVNTAVASVDGEGLTTADGQRVPAHTVVWAAGVRPAAVTDTLEVPRVRGGRLPVNEFLELPETEGCHALGDVAAVWDPETDTYLPPSAAVACQQGRALAQILLARLEEREPEPFRYVHRGELVSLGRHEAVADLSGLQLTGFPAWITWRAFYLSQLMSVKNRLAVALDWSFAYAYQRETVRLDTDAEERVPHGLQALPPA